MKASPEKKDNSAPTDTLITVKFAKFSEKTINHEKFLGMDIAFVIDATSSMRPYILQSKDSIKQIMNEAISTLEQLKVESTLLRFGIVAYRDHPPQDITFVTKLLDFTDSKSAIVFLDNLDAQGGGDLPEAVIDGMNDAVFKLSWKDESEKMMFHVLDSPPHGPLYASPGDGFPKGCPCNIQESSFLIKMRDDAIKYTILKIGNDLDKMIEVFSQYVNIDVMILPNIRFIDEGIEYNDRSCHLKKSASCCGGGGYSESSVKEGKRLKVRKSGVDVVSKEEHLKEENIMSNNIAKKVNSNLKSYL